MSARLYLSSAATFLLQYVASIHRVIDWKLVDWLTIFRHIAVLQLLLKFVLNGMWFSHFHYYVWWKYVCSQSSSCNAKICRNLIKTMHTLMASLIIEWTGYTIQNGTTKTCGFSRIKLPLFFRIHFFLLFGKKESKRKELSNMEDKQKITFCVSQLALPKLTFIKLKFCTNISYQYNFNRILVCGTEVNIFVEFNMSQKTICKILTVLTFAINYSSQSWPAASRERRGKFLFAQFD